MSQLSRDQQIQVIGCLTEGMSIRAIERLTGIHRDTIMRLGAKVGRGCAELHDRMMVGLRVGRLELDELWSYVGKKQRHKRRGDSPRRAINGLTLRWHPRRARLSLTGPASATAPTPKSLSRTCASAF